MKLFRRVRSAVFNYFKVTDSLLLLFCLLASAFSCVLVYSVSVTAELGARMYLMQIAVSLFGLLLAVLLSRLDYAGLCSLWPFLAGLSLVLVALTFTPLGVGVAGTDDTAWLSFFGFTFQPAELMKIAFIMTFATHLNRVKDHINRLPTVLLLCLHGGFAAGLVFLQGDDGTALVFIFIFVGMMFASGLRLLYFLIAGAAGVCALPIVFSLLDEQKLTRILALIRVEEYLDSDGWQQALGLSSMGSGQLWGLGFLQGGGHGIFARENDFIFTVAGEEFGFIGGMFVLALLLGIIIRLFLNVSRTKDYLGRLLCVGMLSLIGSQSLINLGMVLRVLPVVGITLPFFSAGASSVGSLYLGIGLVLSVYCTGRRQSLGSNFTLRR